MGFRRKAGRCAKGRPRGPGGSGSAPGGAEAAPAWSAAAPPPLTPSPAAGVDARADAAPARRREEVREGRVAVPVHAEVDEQRLAADHLARDEPHEARVQRLV